MSPSRRLGRGIAGYYTLAAGGVPLTDLPELARETSATLSRPVPSPGWARLAVDQAYSRPEARRTLLWDAGDEGLTLGIAAFAPVVDAKDSAVLAPAGFDLGSRLRDPLPSPVPGIFSPLASILPNAS